MKERIIGAIVLVVAVVVVVPVFLDGPSDDAEIVSESISLPGQANDGARTVVLDRDRSEPMPQAAPAEPVSESTSAPATDVEPATPEPDVQAATRPDEPAAQAPAVTDADPEPTRAAPPVAAARSSTGMWAVQLGSFSNQGNADRLAADLRQQGFAAFLSDVTLADGPRHRVRVGPQKDRESAEAMAQRLARAGHTGRVVPHP